jgi:hypothetical protein
LTIEEAFSSTVSFAVLHCYWFGFTLSELMTLLNLMRSQPRSHKSEWELWQKELDYILNRGGESIV